jgi:hypothetical protein
MSMQFEARAFQHESSEHNVITASKQSLIKRMLRARIQRISTRSEQHRDGAWVLCPFPYSQDTARTSDLDELEIHRGGSTMKTTTECKEVIDDFYQENISSYLHILKKMSSRRCDLQTTHSARYPFGASLPAREHCHNSLFSPDVASCPVMLCMTLLLWKMTRSPFSHLCA